MEFGQGERKFEFRPFRFCLKIDLVSHPTRAEGWLYIYIHGKMVNFGESDKMSGKVDKSNTYNGFSSNILFFIQGRTYWIKNKILLLNPL